MSARALPVTRLGLGRLLATMATDVRLQLRNGFYWAIGFLLAVYLVVVNVLPEFDWRPLLAPLLLGNLVPATFFFIAGLVLLEKQEGTLEAQITTPLRVAEYLGSKIVTLTGLSLIENLAIVLLVVGLDFDPLPLVVGLGLASAIYCLGGFVAVAPYDSINRFLFPSMPFVALFVLPIVHYAGLWATPLVFLHPLQPSLLLLAGGVRPLSSWEWLYGLLGSVLWIVALGLWCRRRFDRFVVARAGATPR